MQKNNTLINLKFISASVLSFLFFLLPLFLNAQDKYEYERRTDLTFLERVSLAEAYFNKNGKGKGTGYIQFQRWKYWAKRSVNANGYVITSATIQKQVKQFDALYGNQATNFVNNSFTEMGPMSATNTSTWSSALGRLTSFAVANDNTFNHIIVGAPTGGVWKTTNGGTNWTPLFDNMSTQSIWSVVISHTNAQHYVVGTSGGGIYKSTNGGSSWTQTTGVDNWDVINTIRMDPSNANILYAIGQWAGKVYKSTDGGDSWNTIYTSIDQLTDRANRLYDLELKPGTSSTIYVSGRGVMYKSTDSGSTFNELTLPSPYVDGGTIMMGISSANPDYIYALQENEGRFNALFLSTNSGGSFSTRADNSSGKNNLLGYDLTGNQGQAPRDMDVIVSPTNINEVQVAGIETHRSFNGGTTFTQNSSWVLDREGLTFHHADVDALYYVRRNGENRIFALTDGGIYYSANQGVNFTDLTPGIGTRQFYRIGVSKTVKDWVSGGSQDNGTGIHRNDGKWYDWLGADGMETVVDFSNEDIIYGTIQYGRLYKSENGGNTYVDINSPPGRGAWVTPLEQDPTNASTIYMGYQNLHKSMDGGNSWSAISNFPTPPIDNDSDTTLQHVKIAPSNPSTIYATFDARVYKTINGGTNWTAISPTGYDYYYINYMAIHPTDPNRVMLALSHNSEGHRFIETTNGGTNWIDVSSNLPFIGAQCILYTGNADDGIYAGMASGLYYKDNTSSGNWSNIGSNGGLPNVMVSELEIQHDILYVATYGRGLWKTVIGTVCESDLVLNSNNLSGDYMSATTINAAGQINSGSTVTMQAENLVKLNANFHAKSGATFSAIIGTCSLSAIISEEEEPIETQRIRSSPIDQSNPKEIVLQIRPNPIRDYAVIRFYTADKSKASISIVNLNGQLLTQQTTDSAEGWNMTQLEANQLPTGTYLVVLTTETGRWTEKIVVQK